MHIRVVFDDQLMLDLLAGDEVLLRVLFVLKSFRIVNSDGIFTKEAWEMKGKEATHMNPVVHLDEPVDRVTVAQGGRLVVRVVVVDWNTGQRAGVLEHAATFV